MVKCVRKISAKDANFWLNGEVIGKNVTGKKDENNSFNF